MKKIICFVLALIMCSSLLSVVSWAEEGEAANDYELLGGALGEAAEVKTLTHIKASSSSYGGKSEFTMADADVNVTISVYKPSTCDAETPIVFYVMNYVGADECTDEQNIDCINDLLDQGCVVAVTDFMGDERACQPNLDWFVQYIRVNRASIITSLTKGTDYNTGDAYIVPEGYGLVRKIVYYDYEVNAPKGILENIVKAYNGETGSFRTEKEKQIPEGYETASNVYQVVKPNTAPVTLELMLDIVYPRFRENSEVVMVASSSQQNMLVVSKLQRPLDSSAVLRGYTAVIYEHPYVPMSRADAYDYYGSYSYMHNLGNASHSAAVRCVRYYADTYGYSKDKYVSMGISKMAMTGVLTNPNIENVPERVAVSGYTRNDSYGEQPYLAYEDGTPIDSSVSLSYYGMGDGSLYSDTWLSEGCAPAILMCGLYDEYGSWGHWEELQARYDELGLVYFPMTGYNLGHDYPYGECNYYHYDRWAVFYDIISYYLEGDKEATIAFASIYDGSVVGDITVTGMTSSNKYDASTTTLTTGDELFVQFIAPITEDSAKAAITLVDGDGNAVEGTLRGKCGGLKWYFEPTETLKAGTYTLKVADNTAESILNGLTTTEGGSWTFTIK